MKWILSLAIVSALLSPVLLADDLDAQIRALNAKYGAESVKRAMARVNADGTAVAEEDNTAIRSEEVILQEAKDKNQELQDQLNAAMNTPKKTDASTAAESSVEQLKKWGNALPQ